MKNVIIFIGLFFLIQACTSKNDINERVMENYPDGSIKSLKIFLNEIDTINYVLKEFYENGQLKKTGTIKDSIVNGLWHYYYSNGQLEMVGEYMIDDSLNQGNFTYSYKMPIYHRDGSLKKERKGYMCSVSWAERERENLHVCKSGKWNFYHENGQLKNTIDFKKGWSNSYIIEYYPSGIKKIEGKSNKGVKIGEWKAYYNNGQEKSLKYYYQDSIRTENFWLKNGKLIMSKGTGYTVAVDTARYGDSVIIDYVNYLQHGRDFRYRRSTEDYSKFRINTKDNYNKGKLTGISKFYGTWAEKDEESLSSISPYKDGLMHGLCIGLFRYDTTFIGEYINGKEHGEHIRRRTNTLKIDLIERWNMGKRHGVREYYDYEGRPELYQFYFNEKFIGEIKFEAGKKTSERIVQGFENEFNRLRQQTTHNKN